MVSARSQRWEEEILACSRLSDCETAQRNVRRKNSERFGKGVRASSRLPVVSIQVNFIKVYLVLRTWLKQRRIFTQNVFLVQLQTSPEVIKIFVQFHCLSSYRNDRFPSERLQQAKGIRKQCAEMRCKRI